MSRTRPTADAILSAYITVVGFTTTGILAVAGFEKSILIAAIGIGGGAFWGMAGVAVAGWLWSMGDQEPASPVASETDGLSTKGRLLLSKSH